MKDLLFFAADADALAFIRGILSRPQALRIRPIAVDFDRHPQRDGGMVQSGAELARMRKGQYQKIILMWDHHGSGRDHKQQPNEVEQEIQGKLNDFTWEGNSAVKVLVPELEQWLWFCENALAKHCEVSVTELRVLVDDRAKHLQMSADDLRHKQPKELFEHVMLERLKLTISPRDFEEIGKLSSIRALEDCPSFNSILQTLRTWFPPNE